MSVMNSLIIYSGISFQLLPSREGGNLMKELPKVSKVPLEEVEAKHNLKPLIAGIVVGVIAGVSVPATASTDVESANGSEVTYSRGNVQQPSAAVILNRPALDGQLFAAHYSHSSHASHSSHYSCTPGKTC